MVIVKIATVGLDLAEDIFQLYEYPIHYVDEKTSFDPTRRRGDFLNQNANVGQESSLIMYSIRSILVTATATVASRLPRENSVCISTIVAC